MLRLRSSILAHLLSSPTTSHVTQLHCLLLSAAAPRISPNPSFDVEEYLVDHCGLTRAQALKASTKLSHIQSPTNPDAVLGLSTADVATAVAKDPPLLCENVEKTLAPVVVGLAGYGLSHTEMAHLIPLGRTIFRCRSAVYNLPYYMSLFGSIEHLVRFLKQSRRSSLEKVVKPNVAFLRECGLADCDFSKLCLSAPWVIRTNPERIQAMVACAERLGMPPGSGMFRHALDVVAFLGEEKIANKVDYLKNTFRWSDAEVRIASPKLPTKSKEALQSRSKFLISDVRLAPAYIAQHPAMLNYSLEGRRTPRYNILKFLKENGLIDRTRDYYSTLMLAEKVFVEKYIRPYKETIPGLSEDYAAACRGEVPSNFRFA